MKKKTHLRIPPIKTKTIILSLVIAIVLSAFVVYLIQTIHPRPMYEDYCNKQQIPALPTGQYPFNESSCQEFGGIWTKPQELRIPEGEAKSSGYCDFYQDCQEDYNNARDSYKLIVFIITLITGLIAISIGIILHLPSVSSGLMLGGTFLVFYGTIVYWSNLTNWLRTIILGIALVILIWLGYKKLQN